MTYQIQSFRDGDYRPLQLDANQDSKEVAISISVRTASEKAAHEWPNAKASSVKVIYDVAHQEAVATYRTKGAYMAKAVYVRIIEL
jgi:hypothetical protein